MLESDVEKLLAELELRIARLEEENAELKRLASEQQKILAFLLSPHIPSSKKLIKEKQEEKEKQPKKRGAPEGHTGATRKTPEPNQFVDLKPVKCKNKKCKSKKIKIIKKHEKVVEDIKITKVITKFQSYDCVCEGCGTEFTTTSENLPKEGNFGPNITSLWESLHYIGVIPFDRLSKISKNLFNIEISPAAVHNIIYRTARIFEPSYKRRKRRVAKSRNVRSDETGFPVNGQQWHLWNISNGKDVAVLIRPSRGSKVLKEIFGDFFDGILNSDCFSAYNKFKAREYQKCWAHVLSDAKDLAKYNYEGKELHTLLSRMYKYIVKAKKHKLENTPKIKGWIRRSKKKIDLWVDKNYKSKAVANLALRMSKYKNDWFTCLKYPFVEATNNASERDIRKNVLARKISGLHRSQLGIHSREIMMSEILSAGHKNQNPFEIIRQGIENYNLSN
jgi:hypothetical protein